MTVSLSTRLLTLRDTVDEASDHVELLPMDLRRIVVMEVLIPHVCTNKVRRVDLPFQLQR